MEDTGSPAVTSQGKVTPTKSTEPLKVADGNGNATTHSGRSGTECLVPHADDGKPQDAGDSSRKLRLLAEQRNTLWKSAFDILRSEKPDLVANFDAVVRDYARVQSSVEIYSPDGISAVTEFQKTQKEARQWKYHWFGETYKVRDTAQGILTMVDTIQPGIAYGMQFAPPFVSMPWSVVSMLIPYIMKSLDQMNTAINGLKDVTAILASYSIAESEFLAVQTTAQAFRDTVGPLYAKVLEYQVLATQYFGRSTLKSLSREVVSGPPWEDALAAVKAAEELCRPRLDALAVSLSQKAFKELAVLVQDQTKSLEKMIDACSKPDQWKINRSMTDWISTANPFQDHADVRQRLGEEYVGTGQWLFQDVSYAAWQKNSSGILLLQGIVGAGKSCAVSIAVESLMDSTSGCLAFFYCANEFNDGRGSEISNVRRDTVHIFRSILAQCAVLPDGSIAKPVEDAFKLSRRRGPGENDLNSRGVLNLLQEVLVSRDSQLTLVFDALDELRDPRDFLETVQELLNRWKRTRVLFSSRPSINAVDILPGIQTLSVESLNTWDIHYYIDHELVRRFPKRGLKPNAEKNLRELTERLGKALKQFSEGVWVGHC